MFYFFKSQKERVQDIMDAIKDAGEVIPAKVEPTKDDSVNPVYQIGRTTDGRTTLRIGDEYTHSTLTMNPSAVNRLIRMLEIAVEEE
jgi:hypothetical protein